jgi:hypothetical protein
MSGRKFKIGNAEVFQDKDNSDTNDLIKALVAVSNIAQEKRLYATTPSNLEEFMEALSKRLSTEEDIVLNDFISVLVRKTKELKRKKNEKQ